MSWMYYLPTRFLPCINGLSPAIREKLTELRFRLDRPFSISFDKKNLIIDANGTPTDAKHAIRATKADLDELLSRMTGGSLYAFDKQLQNGFIPLEYGCRAGIAGETADGRFREVTSVNLRIPRFLPEFARVLTDRLRKEGGCGVLVISRPAGGKTTFLRSAAWLLCTGTHPFRVGIADERSELWLPDGLFDRITGLPKSKGVELLTRTMSPEFLVCDELGAGEEGSLLAACNTGVHLLASVHGGSVAEALRRPCVQTLLQNGVFALTVFLTDAHEVQIAKVTE